MEDVLTRTTATGTAHLNTPLPITSPININDLVDIRTVVIDQSLPVPEKKRSYLRQIKNPELYRCGDTIVRISHVNTGATLADRLKQYLLSQQGTALGTNLT